MRSLSLRSILPILCAVALTALAPSISQASELPANATLAEPDLEWPLAGWSTLVLVKDAAENEVDLSMVTDMALQRGAATITIALSESDDEATCAASVQAVLEFLDDSPRFDAQRVVFSGYGACAREILVLGNRYPERIRGILAMAPQGPTALPTMWGGVRAPQSLYVMAASAASPAVLDLVDNAAEQWRAAGQRVVVRKHPGNPTEASVFRTQLNLALDWLLMVGGDGC